MFNTEDLKCLNPKYFNIIAVDDYDVTIMSRNTGHYWYLHNPEYPGGIKSHDKWQMNGMRKMCVNRALILFTLKEKLFTLKY